MPIHVPRAAVIVFVSAAAAVGCSNAPDEPPPRPPASVPAVSAPATPVAAPPPAAASTPAPGPVIDEKSSRSPAQRKINSQVLYEVYRAQGVAAAKGVPSGPTGVELDKNKRALVDVRAVVTPALEKTVRELGGTVVSTSVEAHSIIAWMPVLALERLAGDPEVRAIEPRARGGGGR